MSFLPFQEKNKFHGIQTPEEALSRLNETDINRRATRISAAEYMLDVACTNPEVAKFLRPAFSPEVVNQVPPIVGANVVTDQVMQATVQQQEQSDFDKWEAEMQSTPVEPTPEAQPAVAEQQPAAELDWVDQIAVRANQMHAERGDYDVPA